MSNVKSNREKKIFEGFKIIKKKSPVVLLVLKLDRIHYNAIIGVNWLVHTLADLDLKTMIIKTDGMPSRLVRSKIQSWIFSWEIEGVHLEVLLARAWNLDVVGEKMYYNLTW